MHQQCFLSKCKEVNRRMKTKFKLVNKQTKEEEDFYVMQHRGEISILYNGKVYPTLEEDTVTSWNGQNKIVNDKINIVDLGKTKVLIIIGNKYASPEIKVEDGYTVKYNRGLNNLRAGLPLLRFCKI